MHINGLNPFLPLDIYTPDGEPKVFDGRVYLYGSMDLFNQGYCCYSFHVYSADVDNLNDWTDHGESFSTKDIPWSDGLLWAPDVVKKGDTYYMYFCQSDGSEGVAESKTPYGPFKNARRITMNNKPIEGIDPSVLEDNGKYYYTWGQAELRMAELEDDMCTLKPETYHEAVITNRPGQHGFHEGSSLRKIGDTYCIVYASEWVRGYPNCGGSPTHLDYAVSNCIYGPYTRKGTIIDNYGVDPLSWNNHGSIVKIKDEWYTFYHGSSNNSKYSRRARVEKIKVNETTCEITEALISSKGFNDYITPELITEPAHACKVIRGAYLTEKEDGTHPLVNIHSGSGLAFSDIKFEAQKYNVKIYYKGFEDTVCKVYLEQAEPIAQITMPAASNVAEGIIKVNDTDTLYNMCMEFSGKQHHNLCEVIGINFEVI